MPKVNVRIRMGKKEGSRDFECVNVVVGAGRAGLVGFIQHPNNQELSGGKRLVYIRGHMSEWVDWFRGHGRASVSQINTGYNPVLPSGTL